MSDVSVLSQEEIDALMNTSGDDDPVDLDDQEAPGIEGPPGWEVELYRNGTLIEFATVGSDGRYFFPDEENPFGENTFVAKLFGPQGQIHEDRQTFWGGGAELAGFRGRELYAAR